MNLEKIIRFTLYHSVVLHKRVIAVVVVVDSALFIANPSSVLGPDLVPDLQLMIHSCEFISQSCFIFPMVFVAGLRPPIVSQFFPESTDIVLHIVRPWSTKRRCGSRFCSSKRLKGTGQVAGGR